MMGFSLEFFFFHLVENSELEQQFTCRLMTQAVFTTFLSIHFIL